MDITKTAGPQQTETDRDGHSKEESKLLNPTKELYGEVMALIEWHNKNFYGGELASPLVTFPTGQRSLAVYEPSECDHKTGTTRPGFRLNPFLFKQETLQAQCMELLGLMEHQRQGKAKRTNYHDKDYAAGMQKHGLRTQSAETPDKEIGERITLSVIPGGKFERLVAKKQESGFAFSWAFHDKEATNGRAAADGDAKPASKSGVKVEYHCPIEGCDTKGLYGRSGHKIACQKHDTPVDLLEPDKKD